MAGTVSGGVRVLLRLEGLCLLALSLLAYAKFGGHWSTFFWYFLLPDLSFAGYLVGPRTGAIAYNLAHALLGPVFVLAGGMFLSEPAAITAGLIWMAHIGFDRALGYGLKYFSGFRFTHLGVIGRGHADT